MSPLDSTALRDGAAALGVTLGAGQLRQLEQYVELLLKWNRAINLTAIRDAGQVVTHHLLDCLSVVPALQRLGARSVLDVGSGAGLPGLVIAVALPDVHVRCVDAVAKKAAFMQQAAAELDLPRVRAEHVRVETLQEKHDVVTSRAFSSLLDFVALTRGAIAQRGVWVAMKGKVPVEEVATLPTDIDVFHVERLDVPGVDAERCLVCMRRRLNSPLAT